MIIKIATFLAFGVAIIFTLVLVAFWLGFFGNDRFQIVFAVPAGLILLILICIGVGMIFRHTHSLEEQNIALEKEKSMLERRVTNLEQEIAARALAVNLKLRIEGGKVFRGKEEISLTPKEFDLLKCLMSKDKAVCEYAYINEQVYPEEFEPGPLTDRLAALTLRLRNKITYKHDYIRNHPHQGYEFIQWEG